MNGPDPTVSEADLVAFADERLAPSRMAEVEAWLAGRPEERGRVEAWRSQTALLRSLLDPVADEPVPAELKAIVTQSPARPARRWAMPAMAAALALAIGLGTGYQYGSNGWPFPDESHDMGEVVARAGYTAHRLYTAEVRHPVEVAADEKDHLVTWLSRRLDSPLKAPDLSDKGLRLLGGRLVPVGTQPGAQFMYEGANGDRYTVFAIRSDGARPTAFHFDEWGNFGCYYWVDGRLSYSVTGPNDPQRLRDVAREVYEQVS